MVMRNKNIIRVDDNRGGSNIKMNGNYNDNSMGTVLEKKYIIIK